MIWTLVVFFIAFLVLRKYAFGPLAALVEKRRTIVRENLEAAEHSREEAEQLLEEYKQQLAQARREAGEIVERARRTGAELERQMREEATAQRERDVAAAKAAIAAETRQAIDQIKNQVADLTLLATEKVVGRALDEAEGRRLVEEALAEVDFTAARRGVATMAQARGRTGLRHGAGRGGAGRRPPARGRARPGRDRRRRVREPRALRRPLQPGVPARRQEADPRADERRAPTRSCATRCSCSSTTSAWTRWPTSSTSCTRPTGARAGSSSSS